MRRLWAGFTKSRPTFLFALLPNGGPDGASLAAVGSALAINQTGWCSVPHLRMSDILPAAIMRSKIRSPTTKTLSPILLSHLPRRYPYRREACITTHPIGNERMNRIVGKEIRFGMSNTPTDEGFVLCSGDHAT